MWISRKQHAQMTEAVERLQSALETAQAQLLAAQDHAFLVDIERTGRTNKFIFARNGQMHVIETMDELQEKLGIEVL